MLVRASTHLQNVMIVRMLVESPTFAYAPGQLDRLEAGILEAFGTGARSVVLNLDGLTSLDSDGVRDLITLLRRAREQGGDIVLSATHASILRSLRVTALDRLFTMAVTEAA